MTDSTWRTAPEHPSLPPPLLALVHEGGSYELRLRLAPPADLDAHAAGVEKVMAEAVKVLSAKPELAELRKAEAEVQALAARLTALRGEQDGRQKRRDDLHRQTATAAGAEALVEADIAIEREAAKLQRLGEIHAQVLDRLQRDRWNLEARLPALFKARFQELRRQLEESAQRKLPTALAKLPAVLTEVARDALAAVLIQQRLDRQGTAGIAHELLGKALAALPAPAAEKQPAG